LFGEVLGISQMRSKLGV
jgi:hypothetical protein